MGCVNFFSPLSLSSRHIVMSYLTKLESKSCFKNYMELHARVAVMNWSTRCQSSELHVITAFSKNT